MGILLSSLRQIELTLKYFSLSFLVFLLNLEFLSSVSKDLLKSFKSETFKQNVISKEEVVEGKLRQMTFCVFFLLSLILYILFYLFLLTS